MPNGDRRSILITGAAGGIGRHLARFLRARGHEVTGLDLRQPPGDSCDEHYIIDILKMSGTSPFPAGRHWDVLVHLAAITAPAKVPEHHMFATNVLGTFNVLRMAALHRIPRVIFMSSESVLGFAFSLRPLRPQYVPIDERHPLLAHDTYGMSKLLGEELARGFQTETTATVFCLRPPWVWIPEEAPSYAWLTEHPESWAHGLWAYIAIEDLCHAVEKTLQYDGPQGFFVFFVTADDVGVPIPTRDLLRRFYRFEGPFLEECDEHQSIISSRSLKKSLKWQPEWNWKEWLRVKLGCR